MDQITREVLEMYAKFPYPSPQAQGRKLKELANLLKLFCIETGYDLNGKSVLDAGTGTGHRVIEAAKAFKGARFLAVDISETPLEIARRTARIEDTANVAFQLGNVMDGEKLLGTFDIVLSMGVIHHLSDPAAGLRNLVRNLADDGLLFLYVYGSQGGRERMRRKQILALLLGRRHDFERGISLAKELGFDSFDYGWNLNFEDEESRDALIVDAYLNVNEKLFDADSIFDLMRSSGLEGFLIYGLTLDQGGCLFDTRLKQRKGPGERLMTADVASHLRHPQAAEAYEALPLADKYRLMDLFFQPNGYTLMGFKAGSLPKFPENGRIAANMLLTADL